MRLERSGIHGSRYPEDTGCHTVVTREPTAVEWGVPRGFDQKKLVSFDHRLEDGLKVQSFSLFSFVPP